MLISAAIRLAANAIGLIAAAWILDGISLDLGAFIIAVVIFTVVEVIMDPLLTKIAVEKVPALRGGVALVTTILGLIITSLISSGLRISGISTWVLATLIVWLFALIAGLILPLIFLKNRRAENQARA